MDSNSICIGICDDEEFWREKIKKECVKMEVDGKNQLEIIVFSSGEEVLEFEGNLDVIFLDEELNHGKAQLVNGCQVRKRLLEVTNTLVICITSHKKYMESSFGRNVIGFVIKNEKDVDSRIRELLRDGINNIKTKNGFAYIEAYKHYLEVHYIDGHSQRIRITIEEIEKKMENEIDYKNCIKCHRSYIVNLKAVIKPVENFSGFLLMDGKTIPISRARKNQVKGCYSKLMDTWTDSIFGKGM